LDTEVIDRADDATCSPVRCVKNMLPARINGTRLLRTITQLSEIGRDASGGISRFTFSPWDMRARTFVSGLMKDSGLNVRVDDFGNIIGRAQGNEDGLPAVTCGSHVDTVPNGGPLDGAYGVLAGIEIARTIHEQQISIRNPIEIIVFTEEEGGRFPGFLGSMGFTRTLEKRDLYKLRDQGGVTFEEALRAAGYDPAKLFPAHRSFDEIKCYLELHIEQGPFLEREEIAVGAVESITGLAEMEVVLEGKAGHAGATPLALRHDALLGASRIIVGVNEIAHNVSENVIATVGSLEAFPNLSSVIAGRVAFVVDFRASTRVRMLSLQEDIVSLANRVAAADGLRITVRTKSFTEPVRMSPEIVDIVKSVGNSLGLSCKSMHSRAGHDCQLIAHITKTGMIFVPSHDGISHAPGESTSAQRLEGGANVLLNAVLRIANG
jgi:allantoate deiminase